MAEKSILEKLRPYIKLHIAIIIIIVISEIIGVLKFKVWIAMVTLFPMLYAVVLGLIISPKILGKVVEPLRKLVSEEEVKIASPFIIGSLGPLAAKYGVLVGPHVPMMIKYGIPLIAQNFTATLGTVLIGLPVGLLLGLRREAVGASFDICREPALAVVSEKYGLDSPEGLGTLGVYICGTVYGTIWWAFVGSTLGSVLGKVFHPLALAMACGPGSASMMTACSAAMSLVFPEIKDAILAFAVASNLISGVIAVYYDSLVTLPLADKLYYVLKPVLAMSKEGKEVK